jgi:hypothetical protein
MEKSMKKIITLSLISASLFLSACANNENSAKMDNQSSDVQAKSKEAKDASRHHKEVVAGVFEDLMKPVWTEAQQKAIVEIGYYTAASALCVDLNLDTAKVDNKVKANFSDVAKLSESEKQHKKSTLSMHIGMATGLAMGAHIETMPKFCADAKSNKNHYSDPLLKESTPAAK